MKGVKRRPRGTVGEGRCLKVERAVGVRYARHAAVVSPRMPPRRGFSGVVGFPLAAQGAGGSAVDYPTDGSSGVVSGALVPPALGEVRRLVGGPRRLVLAPRGPAAVPARRVGVPPAALVPVAPVHPGPASAPPGLRRCCPTPPPPQAPGPGRTHSPEGAVVPGWG